DDDRFLRFKCITAIERLHRSHRSLTFPGAAIERRVLSEASRYCDDLCTRHALLREPSTQGTLVVRALDERLERAIDCLYRLLGLLFKHHQVAAGAHTLCESRHR